MSRPRKNNDLIVSALAHGKTHAQAARIAGVSERTIGRRAQEPDFAARVNQARAEVTAAATAQLAALTSKAIAVLDDTLDDADEDHAGLRLRAAQIVLKSGLEYRERAELEGRVLALEASSSNVR